jgi:hypothetical protein
MLPRLTANDYWSWPGPSPYSVFNPSWPYTNSNRERVWLWPTRRAPSSCSSNSVGREVDQRYWDPELGRLVEEQVADPTLAAFQALIHRL